MTALAAARSMFHSVIRLLLLVALLLAGAPARATEGEPSVDERVRTGRTELSGPEAGAEPPVTEPSVERESAPADAPRVRHVRMPDVASGFGTYDGGWIRFTFHPSARERIEPLIVEADRVRQELAERLGQPV